MVPIYLHKPCRPLSRRLLQRKFKTIDDRTKQDVDKIDVVPLAGTTSRLVSSASGQKGKTDFL